jgi:hypothetical protein
MKLMGKIVNVEQQGEGDAVSLIRGLGGTEQRLVCAARRSRPKLPGYLPVGH